MDVLSANRKLTHIDLQDPNSSVVGQFPERAFYGQVPLSEWGYDRFRVRRDTTGIIETGDAADMPFETWRD